VMTEVTIKVMPAPPSTSTLLLQGLDDTQAVALMGEALSSPAGVSGAAHLPSSVSGSLPSLQAASGAVTALRLEGLPRSIQARLEHLAQRLLPSRSECTTLDEPSSRRLWQDIGDVAAFADRSERPVWRLSARATTTVRIIQTIQESLECRYFFDWGGALLWIELPSEPLAHQAVVREACRGLGGPDAHATLVRAAEQVRAEASPLPPLDASLAALTERIKGQFDPHRLFNRGRMYAEF